MLTATSQTKSYDGTDSAASLEMVSGLVATERSAMRHW